MTRRFLPSELRCLRNRIPIAQVIETLPGLACRTISGKFSFICPVCGGIDTGINAAHNLARCFACRQNFNPIELVMRHLKISFVDSVKWLKNDMPVTSVRQHAPASNAGNAPPAAIGNILSDVIHRRLEKKSDEPCLESIVWRISRLEDRLRSLYRALNELQSSRHQ
jgi:DNA primase